MLEVDGVEVWRGGIVLNRSVGGTAEAVRRMAQSAGHRGK